VMKRGWRCKTLSGSWGLGSRYVSRSEGKRTVLICAQLVRHFTWLNDRKQARSKYVGATRRVSVVSGSHGIGQLDIIHQRVCRLDYESSLARR